MGKTRATTQTRQNNAEGCIPDQSAAGSKGLGAQLSKSGGLVLHGVIFFPVHPVLRERNNEELLAQCFLHLLVVGGFVEVAGEQLCQQLLENVGTQEQETTEQHSAKQCQSSRFSKEDSGAKLHHGQSFSWF